MAGAAVYLASRAGDYVVRHTIVVNPRYAEGRYLRNPDGGTGQKSFTLNIEGAKNER